MTDRVATDRYGRLGLSRNPFVADPTPGVPDALWIDRHDLLPPAPVPGGRRFVQLLGPKGAGKTTTLLRWRATHAGPYRHVGPDLLSRVRPLPAGPLVYWDEVDRAVPAVLGLCLARCRRRDATVVAGTHRDLASTAARRGFAVETVTFGPITPEAARRWVERRLENVAIADGHWRPGEADLAAAVAAAGSSWRCLGDRLHVLAARALDSGDSS